MLDKIRKQQIGDKEYKFKMTNRTIRKIDEKYGNYGSIIYGLMEGKQFYTNSLKLVSMCCVDKEKELKENKYEEKTKEWDIEALEDIITPQQYQEITSLALNLYLDYMGINDTKEETKKKEVKKEKN